MTLPKPYILYDSWLQEAKISGINDAHAAVLSTVSSGDFIHSRVVLINLSDTGDYLFYTNYNSSKADDLRYSNRAALCLYWHNLGKQIRIEGRVESLSPADSDKYFASRAREKQIAAWASKQSDILPSRDFLDERFRHYEKEFEGRQVSRPENWGGYLVRPDYFEFMQMMPNRLHHREVFRKNCEWENHLLYP